MSDPVAPGIPSPATFGPPLTNFGAIEDPSTQMQARAWNNSRAQLAMLSVVSPICMVSCQYQGAVLSLLRHSAVWGDSAGVVPSYARLSAGRFQFQWATSYFDLRDDGTAESQAVNIRGVVASVGVTTAKLFTSYEVTNSRTIILNVYTDVGVATDPAFLTMVCW